MKTKCSHCHAIFKTSESRTGKKAKCPRCHGVFVIGSLSSDSQPKNDQVGSQGDSKSESAIQPKSDIPPKQADSDISEILGIDGTELDDTLEEPCRLIKCTVCGNEFPTEKIVEPSSVFYPACQTCGKLNGSTSS